jgi:hypothetical protein
MNCQVISLKKKRLTLRLEEPSVLLRHNLGACCPNSFYSGFSWTDDKHRDVQVVTDRVNSVAEDQVLETAVAVRPHNYQVRVYLVGITDDLLLG